MGHYALLGKLAALKAHVRACSTLFTLNGTCVKALMVMSYMIDLSAGEDPSCEEGEALQHKPQFQDPFQRTKVRAM